MRIIHTSDWHLGITLRTLPLYEQQEHFIKQFADIVREQRADAVIIAGDVFDSSVSSAAAIRLYNAAMEELCAKLGVRVIVIAGNHDGAARLASCRALLEKSGLYVTGKLERPVKPVKIGNAAVYPVPFFSADEVRALYPDEEIKTYSDAFSAVCRDIENNMDASVKNIIAAHVFAGGASLSDSDRSAMLGSAQIVSADAFAPFDYAALGHLHRPQTVGKNAYYSGSPLKYSASEAAWEKSVILLDTDNMSVERIPVKPLRDVRVLSGGYDYLAETAEESGDYIYVEVTDRPAGLEMIDFFRSLYPNLVSLRGAVSSVSAEGNTPTAGEVRGMPEDKLLECFFEEIYGLAPDGELKKLFADALAYAAKEEDAQ